MKRYLIGFVLTGQVGEYHLSLTRELARRFGIRPLHERLPPHLTFKPPFLASLDEIEELVGRLSGFAGGCRPTAMTAGGFGYFGPPGAGRTIYLKVSAPAPARDTVRRLVQTLGIPYPTLHASVARFLTPRNFAAIWPYLAGLRPPYFDSSFDHLALLVLEGRRWRVIRQFPFFGEGDIISGRFISKFGAKS